MNMINLVTWFYSTVNTFSPPIYSHTAHPNGEGTLLTDIRSQSAE